METKVRGLVKDSFKVVLKNFQSFLTISYLLTIAIGMIFNYHKYAAFGINIFEYSSLFDFLIAPFNDIKILLISLFTLLLTFFSYRFHMWQKEKYPKYYSKVNFGFDKKPWFNYYLLFSYIFLICFLLYGMANLYGELTKNQIENQEKIQIKYIDDKIVEGVLIGKSSEMLFLAKEDKVVAIPFTSLVKEIEVK